VGTLSKLAPGTAWRRAHRSPARGTELIAVEQLQVHFDRPVLRGVSLKVPAGCVYGLIGPGAAGKSVLLKALCGLVAAQAGSISIDDIQVTTADDATLFELRKRIGMLFQNNALFDFMTVAENIAFPLERLFGLSASETLPRVSERLAAVGLPGFESRLPAGLSGGQRKRVGVARATITQAPVLFYDEPTAGLDPVSTQKLLDLLRLEQQAQKSTVIMTCSDLERLLGITDYVGMMLAGELIFEGTTEAARQSKDPYVRQFLRGETEGPL
jgi:phospholipid/cholesterol/gamma-HCH transport system ATP-binding protein